ncbi:cation:proton antiporter domain-containing protein, partial [Modestobacter versicolor]
ESAATAFDRPGARARRARVPSTGQLERMRVRVRRLVADIDYFLAAPLGWRDGAVVVWAGMRGAVTVAAAQTLPEDTPSRPLLVLTAFLVAISSLLLQGGTLPRLVRAVGAAGARPADGTDDRAAVADLLESAAATVPDRTDPDRPLAVVRAQRLALLDARDDGTHSSAALAAALAVLDAEQISLELRSAGGAAG